jgi:hypothetical protein
VRFSGSLHAAGMVSERQTGFRDDCPNSTHPRMRSAVQVQVGPCSQPTFASHEGRASACGRSVLPMNDHTWYSILNTLVLLGSD